MRKEPVFIVGAGRSGTTLLYKLLALHPQVGYITNYDNHLPAWIPSAIVGRLIKPFIGLKKDMWYKAGGNAYLVKRRWLKRLFPAPAEGESVYSRCGLPLTPQTDYQMPSEVVECLRRRFMRMQTLTGSDVFITKRTANNRRILLLREVFPEALFINLERDGRDVAYSLSKVGWWSNHYVWWAEGTPLELESKGMDSLEVCARNWVEEVRAIQNGLRGIDKDQVLHVRYEALLGQPIHAVTKIMDFLGLPLVPEYLSAVDSIGLTKRDAAWRSTWTPRDIQTVLIHQSELLEELRYL